MEATLFPNRPALPVQTTKPTANPNHHRLKSNSSHLSLPAFLPEYQQQQSASSPQTSPLDSLLQNLLHISSPAKSSLAFSQVIPSYNQDSLSAHFRLNGGGLVAKQEMGDQCVNDQWFLDFIPESCKFILTAITEHPVSNLRSLFDSMKFKLLEEVSLMGLLKALDFSGNTEKAILLFEWVVLKLDASNIDKLDSQTIEFMVKILGRESQHSITSKLFDVIPFEEYTLDIRAWTTILHAYSRCERYEKAIALFHFVKCRGLSPSLVTYNVMLDVYGRKGRSWDKILDLLDEMRSLGLCYDEFTCSTVISACGRQGLLAEAKSFFDGIKLSGYIPGTVTYNSLLQVYGKAGVYNEALSILKEMEECNCPPDSVTYNELVSAYVRAGFHDGGAALIGTMAEKGILPDAVTYTTVIGAYGKAGRVDTALSLFKQMKESGCVPNVSTYNAILGMLGKKSRIEEMMEIICDMKSNGCTPDRTTWNTMLSMCGGNKGMHPYVNRVFHAMKNCGFDPDRCTFNTLINAYGRCGSEVDVGKMHDEVVRAGFSPCITTYNALLNAVARRGDWKAAESVILDMRNKGFKPNETTYSLMLHGYANGRNIGGIERIAEEIYDGHIFASWMLCRTLILSNFKCRSLAGMERAFEEFMKYGYKPDLVLLNCMVSIFARNKMQERAHDMLRLIRECGLHPNLITYNSLMDMYARSRECWKARNLLDGLLENGVNPDLVSYNTVIKGFCRQGLMEEALEIFTEMTTRGIRPCIVTYNTLVAGFSGRGFFGEVDELIGYMIENNCSPDELTYNTVVDGYCKSKRYKDAMKFVARIRDKDDSYCEQALQRLVYRVRESMES